MTNKDEYLDNAGTEAAAGLFNRQPSPQDQDRRLAWWREARFGMFIHWGLYSKLGGEWKGKEVPGAYGEHIMLRGQIPVKEYETVAEQFNPVNYDADAWVKTAKDAGMKYFVITAKHHDGFAMYDSAVSDFNIVRRSSYGKDPMQDLAEACRRHGIQLCFYYSHAMDWHHPDSQGNTHDYPNNIGAWDPLESWVDDEDKHARFERYLQEKAFPQIKELLTQYGPIGVIWFDCGHKVTDEQGQRFVDYVRSLQPDCLVNRRVRRDGFGDYGNSGDNQLHIRAVRKDWESIHTMNQSWGYKRNDHDWKSVKDILHNMIDVLSMNGNYLLNVGPTAEGEFDSKSIQILNALGRWMKVNGDSVYGTTGSPIGKPQWGRVTAKGQRLYLHVFDWPAGGKLIVPGIRNRVSHAYLLASSGGVSLPAERINEEDLSIQVPDAPIDPDATVIVLEFEGAIEANPVTLLLDHCVNRFGAFDGEIEGETLRYDTGKKNHDTVTHWSDPKDSIRWTFRASSPGVYGVEIVYAAPEGRSGGSFTMEVCGHPLQGMIKPQGGDYDWQMEHLGTISIDHPGRYSIEVKARTISSETLMKLKEVRLIPPHVLV